jgi:hypothetical protein
MDDAPWGFAPFHYGRWVILDGTWGWVPGPVRIRAVYAPALVVFVGGGPRLHYYFGVGAGIGVAWFPLGPREVYIPPYRASRIYITNVNISHTVIVNQTNIWRTDVTRQHYVNRTARDAVTAVPEDVFAGGRGVGRSAVKVTAGEIAKAHIGGSAPPVTPTRGSVNPIQDSARPAQRPPDVVARRQITVRRTPATPSVPFDQKRPTLERDPGRAPDPARIDEMRRTQPEALPQYRQAHPPAKAPERVEPSQRTRPTVTPPATRGTDQRRRTIERERQRADSQSTKQRGKR